MFAPNSAGSSVSNQRSSAFATSLWRSVIMNPSYPANQSNPGNLPCQSEVPVPCTPNYNAEGCIDTQQNVNTLQPQTYVGLWYGHCPWGWLRFNRFCTLFSPPESGGNRPNNVSGVNNFNIQPGGYLWNDLSFLPIHPTKDNDQPEKDINNQLEKRVLSLREKNKRPKKSICVDVSDIPLPPTKKKNKLEKSVCIDESDTSLSSTQKNNQPEQILCIDVSDIPLPPTEENNKPEKYLCIDVSDIPLPPTENDNKPEKSVCIDESDISLSPTEKNNQPEKSVCIDESDISLSLTEKDTIDDKTGERSPKPTQSSVFDVIGCTSTSGMNKPLSFSESSFKKACESPDFIHTQYTDAGAAVICENNLQEHSFNVDDCASNVFNSGAHNIETCAEKLTVSKVSESVLQNEYVNEVEIRHINIGLEKMQQSNCAIEVRDYDTFDNSSMGNYVLDEVESNVDGISLGHSEHCSTDNQVDSMNNNVVTNNDAKMSMLRVGDNQSSENNVEDLISQNDSPTVEISVKGLNVELYSNESVVTESNSKFNIIERNDLKPMFGVKKRKKKDQCAEKKFKISNLLPPHKKYDVVSEKEKDEEHVTELFKNKVDTDDIPLICRLNVNTMQKFQLQKDKQYCCVQQTGLKLKIAPVCKVQEQKSYSEWIICQKLKYELVQKRFTRRETILKCQNILRFLDKQQLGSKQKFFGCYWFKQLPNSLSMDQYSKMLQQFGKFNSLRNEKISSQAFKTKKAKKKVGKFWKELFSDRNPCGIAMSTDPDHVRTQKVVNTKINTCSDSINQTSAYEHPVLQVNLQQNEEVCIIDTNDHENAQNSEYPRQLSSLKFISGISDRNNNLNNPSNYNFSFTSKENAETQCQQKSPPPDILTTKHSKREVTDELVMQSSSKSQKFSNLTLCTVPNQIRGEKALNTETNASSYLSIQTSAFEHSVSQVNPQHNVEMGNLDTNGHEDAHNSEYPRQQSSLDEFFSAISNGNNNLNSLSDDALIFLNKENPETQCHQKSLSSHIPISKYSEILDQSVKQNSSKRRKLSICEWKQRKGELEMIVEQPLSSQKVVTADGNPDLMIAIAPNENRAAESFNTEINTYADSIDQAFDHSVSQVNLQRIFEEDIIDTNCLEDACNPEYPRQHSPSEEFFPGVSDKNNNVSTPSEGALFFPTKEKRGTHYQPISIPTSIAKIKNNEMHDQSVRRNSSNYPKLSTQERERKKRELKKKIKKIDQLTSAISVADRRNPTVSIFKGRNLTRNLKSGKPGILKAECNTCFDSSHHSASGSHNVSHNVEASKIIDTYGHKDAQHPDCPQQHDTVSSTGGNARIFDDNAETQNQQRIVSKTLGNVVGTDISQYLPSSNPSSFRCREYVEEENERQRQDNDLRERFNRLKIKVAVSDREHHASFEEKTFNESNIEDKKKKHTCKKCNQYFEHHKNRKCVFNKSNGIPANGRVYFDTNYHELTSSNMTWMDILALKNVVKMEEVTLIDPRKREDPRLAKGSPYLWGVDGKLTDEAHTSSNLIV